MRMVMVVVGLEKMVTVTMVVMIEVMMVRW
jgi:hypothetical protein